VLDHTTYEIIRSALYNGALEMKIAMMRAAASPIIHSGGDASAAIFDADMQLVAQGNDIPTMLGSAVLSVAASINAIGIENLRPGDVVISNDAYLGGGNHQPDVQLTRPIFCDDQIIAYVMTRGHWSDIGGQSPGSFNPDTWDIFGEGVRIPPVLLFRDDQIVRDVHTLIVQNTRDPDARTMDIKAQYAGTFVGQSRVLDLVARYGRKKLALTMSRAIDQSETLTRAAIKAMPDGTYSGEDFIEPVGDGPLILIKVAVTIKNDQIHVDFTGSASQVRGGINCPFAVTCNSVWFTLKAITGIDIPINQGCYRPVDITAPEGSIVNCQFPASVVSGNTETSPRIIDLLLSVLAPAIPDRVIAQSHCAASAANFSGLDPDQDRCANYGRRYATAIDVHAGGMGARPSLDGINAIRVHVGNTSTASVEMMEHLSPLTIESWSIVPDSGGAGRYRGGCTTQRTYRMEYEEATFTIIGERERVPPQGLNGGEAGAPFSVTIARQDGRSERVPAKGGQYIVSKGETIRVQPAGSGGYGPPDQRDREALAQDLLNGYVSAAGATRYHQGQKG
jgi:N-methylhydantoinase B